MDFSFVYWWFSCAPLKKKMHRVSWLAATLAIVLRRNIALRQCSEIAQKSCKAIKIYPDHASDFCNDVIWIRGSCHLASPEAQPFEPSCSSLRRGSKGVTLHGLCPGHATLSLIKSSLWIFSAVLVIHPIILVTLNHDSYVSNWVYYQFVANWSLLAIFIGLITQSSFITTMTAIIDQSITLHQSLTQHNPAIIDDEPMSDHSQWFWPA